MFAIFRQRNFSLIWVGGLISQIGDWMLSVVLPTQIYILTESVLATGIMFIVEMLPRILFGSLAGVFADRWERKHVLIASDILRALLVSLIFIVRSREGLWVVYVVAALIAIINQFFNPALQAMIPDLVDDTHLVAANSLTSLSSNLTRLIGPALGGALMTLLGFNAIIAIDAMSFAISGILTLLVVVRSASIPLNRVAEPRGTSLWREWWEGVQMVRQDPLIRTIFFIMATVMPAEGILDVLFVVFVNQSLHGGSFEFGLLLSAQAVGGIAASLLIAHISQQVHLHWLIGLSGITNGFLLLLIFNFPSLWLALTCFIIAGFPVVGFFVSMTTLLQTRVRDQYRGRVFGALTTITSLMMLMGMGGASLLGDQIGILPLLNVVGFLNISAGLLALLFLRTSRP